MTQRGALIIASIMTGCLLVLIACAGLTVQLRSLVEARVAAQMQAPISNSNSIAVQISSDQAAQIALGLVPGAQLTTAPRLVNFQGAVAYEVALNQGNVYVDANTGQVLFNSATTNSTTPGRNRERRFNPEGQGNSDD